MASSSYWYSLYTEQKNLAKKYDGQIKELNKILDNLENDLGDEINHANREIDDLKEDLGKAVRHNAAFTVHTNALESEKEKSAAADSDLSVSIRELDSEIARLTTLRDNAISASDDYYRRYEEAKEAEWQEYLEQLRALAELGGKK